MASVTVIRIETVRTHIAAALAQTSSRSTLTEKKQKSLLAQSCAEACDLIEDWLHDPWWELMRPRNDGPLGESFHDQQAFVRFLDKTLTDALAKARAAQGGVCISSSLVDKSRAAVAATAERHLRTRRRQLFDEANDIVSDLKQEVCDLARHLRNQDSNTVRRERARAALIKVSYLALSIAVAMAGVGPHQMAQNLSEWKRGAVVMIYHIFDDVAAEAIDDVAAEAIEESSPRRFLTAKLEGTKAKNRPVNKPGTTDGTSPMG